MDGWRKTLWVLCLLLLCGCRAGRITEPLERENRQLEDRIYCLEDQLRETCAQLDSAHRENSALRRDLGDGPGSDDFTRQRGGGTSRAPRAELGAPADRLPGGGDTAPRPSLPVDELDDAPPYKPPTILPPSPDRPEGILPETSSPEPDPGPIETQAEPEPAELPLESSPGPTLEEPRMLISPTATRAAAPLQSASIVEIALNSRLTGGHDRDGLPGDDGVMVVIEPRNKARQVVELPAAISIVVLDPAQEGPQARIARWDFTAEEAAKHFKKTALGEGFHFALPWSSAPPRNSELMLFARITLSDGQEYITDKAIRVKLSAAAEAGQPMPAAGNPDDTVAETAPRAREAVGPATDHSVGEPERIVSEYVPRHAERAPAANSRTTTQPGRARRR